MTSFYANPLHVVFVVYPDIVLLDLVGPLQVFTHACKAGRPAYQTHVVSNLGGRVPTNTVVPIETDPLDTWLDGPPLHTLVIVGGQAARDPGFIARVGQLAARAQRVCSVCSGALVLAATGLLDGRRAVTHWEDCDQLAAQYPAVQVAVDPIYIKDGHIWTSAGITAGIDMALAIIAEDPGSGPINPAPSVQQIFRVTRRRAVRIVLLFQGTVTKLTRKIRRTRRAVFSLHLSGVRRFNIEPLCWHVANH